MLIDVCTIVIIALGISEIFDLAGNFPDYLRGILFVVVIILYEPILISVGSTIGQLLLNIRVRSFTNPDKKLIFPFALFRFIVKMLLGWISFLTVTFNKNRRAIHDYASDSVMIARKIENKQ